MKNEKVLTFDNLPDFSFKVEIMSEIDKCIQVDTYYKGVIYNENTEFEYALITQMCVLKLF